MNIKYHATLLIESCLSNSIYCQEIESLKNYLLNNESINQLYIYNDIENPHINHRQNIEDSIKNNQYNLVFIVTDNVSKAWKNGSYYNLIDSLKNNALVSIINVLPQELHHKIAVDHHAEVSTLPKQIKNNQEMINKLPFLVSESEFDDSLTVPFVNINRIESLLKCIINGGKVNNAFLYKINSLDDNKIMKESDIKTYRAMSSEMAFSLLSYMSNTSKFTLATLENVRKDMLPQSDKSVLVECLLSGFFEKEVVEDNIEVYSMKNNIKEFLEGKITQDEYYNLQKLLNVNEIEHSSSKKFKI